MKRVLMLCAAIVFAFAAAAGDRLPNGMLAHVSTKSLAGAVANLDALVGASVKGTPAARQFQPGMLPMLLGIFSPIPLNAWDMNGEVHAMVLVDASGMSQPIVVVKTPGLDAFRKAMTEGGVKLEGDGNKMSGFVPKLNGTWYFADLGDGLVAGALTEAGRDAMADIVSGGWRPGHASGADLSVALDVKNILVAYKERYDAGMRELRAQFEHPDANMEKLPESAKPLMDAVGRMLVRLVDKVDAEVPAMNILGFDIFLGDERLKLASSLTGDAGSGVESLRAAYAGAEQPKYVLAKAMPQETALLDTTTNMSKLPPGVVDFYVESLREIGKEVIPEKAEELAGLPKRFLDLGLGECAAGSYLAGDRPVMTAYFDCAKPKEFLDLMPRAIELGQEFLNGLFKTAGEGERFSFEAEYHPDAGKVGDLSYQRVDFRFNHPESGEPFVYEILFAVGPKTVTAVYGQVEEEDLSRALDNLKSSSGAFIDSEPVRKSVADIDRRQARFMTMRPLPTVVNLFLGQVAMAGGDVDAVRKAAADIEAGPACFAIGIGATDKAVTMEWSLPGAVVGDFIRNSQAIDAMVKALPGPNADDGAGYEPDDSQDETGNGDVEAGGEE